MFDSKGNANIISNPKIQFNIKIVNIDPDNKKDKFFIESCIPILNHVLSAFGGYECQPNETNPFCFGTNAEA